MKKSLVILLTIVFTNSGFAQFTKIDTSFYSNALDEIKMVDVYLPPDYDQNLSYTYPVIYYLHGAGGNQNSSYSLMSLLSYQLNSGTIEPLIMISPNGSCPPFMGSMYLNSELYGNYEDYISVDLIEWVENSFRAEPGRNYRSLMGQSMGANGSFYHGIKYKNLYRGLAAHGAGPNLDIVLPFWQSSLQNEISPGPPYIFDYYAPGNTFIPLLFTVTGGYSPDTSCTMSWVNPPVVQLPYDENLVLIDSVFDKWKLFDISRLIKTITPEDSLGIFFGAGENDELFFYPANLAFIDTLDMLGLEYEFFTHTGGHAMPYWFKDRSLTFLDSIMGSPVYNSISNNQFGKFDLSVYPNPIENIVNISVETQQSSNLSISIYNQQGQLIDKITNKFIPVGKQSFAFDTENWIPGLYLCHLQLGNNGITKKIIKMK